jgi:hypothetical protein
MTQVSKTVFAAFGKTKSRNSGVSVEVALQAPDEGDMFSSSSHRCCAERNVLGAARQAAARHGVHREHKIGEWVRRKYGGDLTVWRVRADGSMGCCVPCPLCRKQLVRFDLRVHMIVTDLFHGHSESEWFHGRMTDHGAPKSKPTSGQIRHMNFNSV